MRDGERPVVGRETDEYGLVDEVAALTVELAQRIQQHASATAAELGLTLSQAKVLVEMGDEGTVATGALATKLRIDPSNLTLLIDRLEQRGALERHADLTDRRVKSLVLTPTGRRLRDDFRERLHDYGQAFGHLSDQQLAALRDLLRLALNAG